MSRSAFRLLKASHFSLLLFLCCFFVWNMNAQILQKVEDFGENPGNLRMFFYQPPQSSTPAGKKMPLVVVLHGCTQSAGVIAAQTGWNKLADEYGFMVIYPQQKMINNPEMCFCWYRRKDITAGKGEDESIMEMIRYVKAHVNIDSSRVFITGLSAGACMSVAMMATHPETFNAGAIFAGVPYKAALDPFTACLLMPGWIHKSPNKWALKITKQNPGFQGSYPRMIIYQGKNDPIVNRRNGVELVKQWTRLHRVALDPSETIMHFAGTRDIERQSFRNEQHQEQVVFYKINHLSHAYLINPGHCINEGGKRGIYSKDKNYFSTWWTAVDFGLTNAQHIEGKPTVESEEKNLEFSVPLHEQSTYNWTYPGDCKVVSGLGTYRLVLDWGSQEGTISVEETTATGCRLPSLPLKVYLLKKTP